jgi:hypothetical protein
MIALRRISDWPKGLIILVVHPHPYTQSKLVCADVVCFPNGKDRISQEMYLNLKKRGNLLRQEKEQTYCEDDKK